MTDTYCAPGEYSYLANAQRQAFNLFDELFPEGWGMEGETPEGTIRQNAIEGLWLPLLIPAGCDGAREDGKPTGIFYADTRSAVVTNRLDHFGAAHSSPEVDDARYAEACAIGLESATYTSGSPYVREA